jgi:hypothetical protein
MTANTIVLRVIEALDAAAVPYMLVGSYSSNVHGIPRSTHDADFVIDLPSDSALAPIARSLGPDLRVDPQLLLETVTGNHRYVITHIASPFKVELFLLSADPHHQERFKRRLKRQLEGRDVWFQTAEDVIIQKLRWYARAKREKDRGDVADVLDTRGDQLDLDYIRRWTDQHGTRELFEQLYAESKQFEQENP